MTMPELACTYASGNPINWAQRGWGYLIEWRVHAHYHTHVAVQQHDHAWPKMRRILARHGVEPGQELTYRALQALVGRFPDLLLCPPPKEPQPAGSAGGGKEGQHPEDKGLGGQGGVASQKRQVQGQRLAQRTSTPTRLWHPWPQPRRELLARARQLLGLIQRELVEEARESLPVGWDWQRLAVRGEMAQLDPARRWEHLGLPRLLIAIDQSGSIGPRLSLEFMALGASLAHIFPWLLLAAAPNGELEPLLAVRDKHYIADGRWHSFGPVDQGIWRRPTLTKRSGSGYLMADWESANLDNWRRLLARHPVAAVIYVGDDQGIDTFEALAPGRVGLVLNYQASWTRERLTVSHQAYGVRTAAPCVVGVGDAISALEAIRLLIPRIVCQ